VPLNDTNVTIIMFVTIISIRTLMADICIKQDKANILLKGIKLVEKLALTV